MNLNERIMSKQHKDFQQHIFYYFMEHNIHDFVGVPDSTLKSFIGEGLKNEKVIIATNERESIGIATGISLSKRHCLVFMQNSGLADSIGAILSLIKLYKIPLIFLVGWRGYNSKDAPEHLEVGKNMETILKILHIPYRVVDDKNWHNCCKWSIKRIYNDKISILVIKND